MNLSRGFASASLCAGLAVALLVGWPGAARSADIAGDWDTVIASPKRPWIFLVHFEASGDGWNGVMRVRGLPEFQLSDVRVDSLQVSFLFPPELDALHFEGTFAGDEIVGRVVEGGEPTVTRLNRVVALPTPRNSIEAWQQDLDFAEQRMEAYDRSFAPEARQRFREALARLKGSLSSKNESEILVELSRAVALADNAHTWMRFAPTHDGSLSTIFPIRICWFHDGPFVIRSAPGYARALRCRVVAVNGHDLLEVRKQVDTLFAGNHSWADYVSPLYLVKPHFLFGLGLIPSAAEAKYTFEQSDGVRFDLTIAAVPVDRSTFAMESWQELSPVTVTGTPPWLTAISADTPDHLDARAVDGSATGGMPLYLRHPDRPYWFELLPSRRLLYVQYNRATDADEGPSFSQFGDSLLAFARSHAVEATIIDLRLNSGGDLNIGRAFFEALAKDEKLNRPGHLFVITGESTFSAGLYHAAQLKQLTHARFVGEPVGDRLDYWAEGGEIVLPNSRVVISYSNGFHRYSGRSYPENQPYYEELSVPSLEPDIPAPLNAADYFAGEDPSLRAIEHELQH
ncbi:MAG: hypothetical protein U0527_01345 [Candidatus Eisenbacteria bacterium]